MTIRSAMRAIRRHPRGHRSTPALLAALLLAATAIDAAAPNHTPAAHSNLLEASIDNVVGTPDDLIFVNGFDPAAAAVVYRYDDGDGNANQGPPSAFDPDMLWGNYYLVQTGGEVITEISVAFGPTFPSLADGPVTFWLLQDADMDLDPRNATALTSVTATPDVFNDSLFTVQIPPTQVQGALFVGASARLLGGEDRPARVDTGAAGDKSWFYAPDIAEVIDDLAAAPFASRMDDTQYVIVPGAFMIRASGTAP